MAQQVKSLTAKPDNLSSKPRICTAYKERTDSLDLAPTIQMYTVALLCSPAYTINKQKQ